MTSGEYNLLSTFIGSFVYILVDHKQNKMVVMMNKCITAINLTNIFASLAFHGELMLSRNALKSRLERICIMYVHVIPLTVYFTNPFQFA